MVNKRFVSINIAITTLFLLPLFVGAQDGLVPCDGPDCNFDTFIRGIRGIINWFITVAASLSALGFAYVGFILLTKGSDSEARSKAKDVFGKIALGFFFVLASWLIVQLITSVLGNDSIEFFL